VLAGNGIAISMDGKGAWRDNVFVERLWRSVKYEEVYLRAYESVSEARISIGRYLDFYNRRRPHSSLDGSTRSSIGKVAVRSPLWSELGLRTDKSFALADGILTLRSRFAWAHDYDPARSIAATFQSLPGASFVVNGAAQAADSALTTASAEMKWLNGWSVAATFEGEFSSVTRSYAGKGVVRYAW
jgi:Integrase core domain/Autotransporter beta-domain